MKLSKPFYLGSIFGGQVAGMIMVVMAFGSAIAGAVTGSEDAANAGAGIGVMFGILGALAFLYGAVINLVLWYKAWESIQDGQARTSPGLAVGLLFVPLFNIYWVFQTIWGFSQDYNKFIARHNKSVPRLNENLFLGVVVASILSMVPVVGIIAGLAALVLGVMAIVSTIDAVNALGENAPQAMSASAGQ